MTRTALDRIATPQCSRLLGWHVLDSDASQERVRIGFEGKPEFCNPAGLLQGGILCAMLDDTMGPAVFLMTEGRRYPTTISITVNFPAPAGVGPLVGEAKVVKLGSTVAFVEGKLLDNSGTVVATATASAKLVDAAKALS